MNRFSSLLHEHGLVLQRTTTQVLQINVGKKCNQTCVHCHVNAGPARREMMTRETMLRLLAWLAQTAIPTVDITGGAPELNPHFRFLVEEARSLNRRVMDRCNLTILFEPGQENLAEFLAHHQVEVVASLPCYGPENVDKQRGDGVFDKSIRALQKLNGLGYGRDENLQLNLVYNPNGVSLPAPQKALEEDYKTRLHNDFGIVFNHLFTITNMPIARFASFLQKSGKLDEYQELLVNAFNPQAVQGLMCRNTLNISWQGEVYDCDFNQMLGLPWSKGQKAPLYLWDINPHNIETRPILTANHCFGCTAGAGSSCGGALV
ncbi:MAG TPA: arsenosugar biosynthesis radical SAM (seleno)protein ArsS [Abditibacteriaceae bacterium]|jgi:radical SAM/Cys-rich protein